MRKMRARYLHSKFATLIVAFVFGPAFVVACGNDDDGIKVCPTGTVPIGGDCVPTGDTADADTVSPDVEVTDTSDTTDTPDTPDASTGVTLPFALDDYFGPSGYFPEDEASSIVAATCPSRPTGAMGLCHGFTWTPTASTEGFAGVWWQNPDGNWGDDPGLDVPAGASSITFTAWGAAGGESVEFLSGYESDGYERKTSVITLTTTPTEYTLSLAGVSYTDIAGGFGWVATSTAGNAITLYIDDIVMNGPIAGAGCTDSAANNYDASATADDGSCLYDVTFSVDMGCSGVTVTSPVSVTGPFCSWCATGFELADANSDGVWTGTFPFLAGALEFKYMANAFAIQEDLIGDGACAVVTDGATFANRQVTISGPASFTDTWGQCTACGTVTLDQLSLPITFDEANVDYTMVDFGGTVTTLVADPTDATNMVAQTVKSDTAASWAGTTMSTELGLAAQIPFTASATTMNVRVYSPNAGVPVRLKVEDRTDATKSVETEAVTTVANAWETLVFDFDNEATGTTVLNLNHTFNKASIFFNFGTEGATAGTKTYLWDDVAFGGVGPAVSGCTDPAATNYNSTATTDDGSCTYSSEAIVLLTFDDASSTTGWAKVADATSAEASIAWSAAGVSGGALLLTASNTSDAMGKAYIFQYDATGLDYGGATSVRVTFDAKVATSLSGTALHLQTNIPGVGVTNNFDIQNQGLNDTSFKSYSFDFTSVDPAGTTFSIHFNMAAGAFVGAGGAILIDNIRVVGLGGTSEP